MTTIARERLEEALNNPTKVILNYGETLAMARIVLASMEPLEAEPDEIPPGLTGGGLKTASRIMSVIEHFEGLNGTDPSKNLVLLAGVLAQYMLDNNVTDFDVLTGDVKVSVDIGFKD